MSFSIRLLQHPHGETDIIEIPFNIFNPQNKWCMTAAGTQEYIPECDPKHEVVDLTLGYRVT